MRVLDATFLVDYLDGVEVTREYLEANEGESFVVPTPAYAEVLVGEGNGPDESDIAGVRGDFGWTEVYAVDERTAATAAEIAAEIGPEGPFLAGCDALIAAVGRELDAPVVTADRDLTHPAVRDVVEIERYRD